MNWFALIITACAGAVLPIQGAINARLGRGLANPVLATLSSFITGTIALLLYVIIVRSALPNAAALGRVPAWAWLGGLLGCLYLGIMIWSVPRLGTATAFGVAIAGQIILSVVLDHFGLLGLKTHPISLMRAAGVALLLTGVILVQRG